MGCAMHLPATFKVLDLPSRFSDPLGQAIAFLGDPSRICGIAYVHVMARRDAATLTIRRAIPIRIIRRPNASVADFLPVLDP